MKKTIFNLFVLILTFSMVGCKKDQISDKPISERILGKWTFVSQATETLEPPNPPEVKTQPGETGDYIDFRQDGIIYYVINSSDERQDDYKLNGAEIDIDGGTYTIIELTETSFIMRSIEQEDDITYTTTITLRK